MLHGAKSYLLQDKEGQVLATHSVSAGLDYPGVGPEHSYYKETGRGEYVNVSDTQALEALRLFCLKEGIIPALESAHAPAYLEPLCKKIKKDSLIIANLSGRGDKDMEIVRREIRA